MRDSSNSSRDDNINSTATTLTNYSSSSAFSNASSSGNYSPGANVDAIDVMYPLSDVNLNGSNSTQTHSEGEDEKKFQYTTQLADDFSELSLNDDSNSIVGTLYDEPLSTDTSNSQLNNNATNKKGAEQEEGIGINYNVALLNYKAGDIDKAKSDLIEVIKKNPAHTDAYLLLGKINYEQRDLATAVKNLTASLSLDGSKIETLLLLGKIHMEMGNLTFALEYIEKAFALDPQNRDALQLHSSTILHLRQLAVINSNLNSQVEESFKKLEESNIKMLKENPYDLKIRQDLQNIYWSHNKLQNILNINELYEIFQKDIWKTILALRVGELKFDDNELIIGEILRDYKHDKDVNKIGKSGFAPIHVCSVASLALLNTLIVNYKADINLQDKEGFCPITIAATHKRKEVVELLLNKGANLALVTKLKENIFHSIVRHHVEDSRNLYETTKLIIEFLKKEDGEKKQITLIEEYGKSNQLKGTNLLSQLLVQQNKNGQTPLMLADELGKTELLGLFRETLADIINERLSSFSKCLYVNEPVDANNLVRKPLFAFNDYDKLKKQSPDSYRAMKCAETCLQFVNRTLPQLPGSANNISSPHYNDFGKMIINYNELLNIWEKKDEVTRIKANITEVNYQIAKRIVPVVLRVMEHSFFNFQRLSHLTTTMNNSMEIIAIVPQDVINACKNSLKTYYEAFFAARLRDAFHGDGKTQVMSTPLLIIEFSNIRAHIHEGLKIKCIYEGNDPKMLGYVSKFINAVDFEIKEYLKKAEKSIRTMGARRLATKITEGFGIPEKTPSQEVRLPVAGMLEKAKSQSTMELSEQIELLLKEKIIEEHLIIPANGNISAAITEFLQRVQDICMKVNPAYRDLTIMEKLPEMGYLLNFSSVPSFKILMSIFEELTGIQLQVRKDNFGFVLNYQEEAEKASKKSDDDKKQNTQQSPSKSSNNNAGKGDEDEDREERSWLASTFKNLFGKKSAMVASVSQSQDKLHRM